MQLGIRFHDTAELPFEERIDEIRRQGFSCTHIALSKVIDLPGGNKDCPLTPGILTPGYAMHLRHIFEKKGLDVAVLGCYLNLAHPDPEKRSQIQEMYRAHLRFASLLGAGVVGTETGAPNAAYRYDKEACHSEEALRIFIENLRPVVKDAEKYGVILAIEPVYKHIVWNAKRARQVLDEIASPKLQIIFDPVNLLHPDNVEQRDEVIGEAIDLLAKEIMVIHMKDYIPVVDDNGQPELKSLACGKGVMDYREIIRFAKTKPYIHATLEDTKPDNAEAARRYLEDLML